MREKIIDVALIVTLVIVAFGITWTLLTLNRSQTRPTSEPEMERESPNSTDISPLPVNPVERRSSAPSETASREDEQTASTQERNSSSEASVNDPEPVPPGPVRIQRIGFSFVTGGAGACGVVLEPWRHVAVSRELLAAYGCGAEVSITLEEEKGGRQQFDAVIGDTMNPSFSRTVNIYVGEDEPALQYGVTSGTLRP